MLDISFVRNNPQEIERAAKKKGFIVDIKAILILDAERRKLQQEYDQIRAAKHHASSKIGELSGSSREKIVKKLKEVDKKEQALKPKLAKIEEKFSEILSSLPNPPLPEVPEGKGEKDNVVLRVRGKPPKFAVPPLDHVELGTRLNILDFERGSKVAGAGFYFLRNEGARLELALVQYALDFLSKKGFEPFLTPDLARSRFYLGTGYLPRGKEAQIFELKDQDLGLIATAEVTLAGLHADEILDESTLPRRYAGYSHCFRQEAGSYGRHSRGLYRVHQFTKVEMFAYTKPPESSKMHQEFLEIEENLWSELGIPFRVVEMCTGALGAQAARKFDLEAWMPGRSDWGEVTSTSNTTDYQARRLGIRYRSKEGDVSFAHTLNGTAIATSRAIIAILENYQQKDGSVVIPDVLRPYMGGMTEIRR